jgi:calcium/calmodulin-dependent protein kinase (CaM kinase) II
MLVGLTRELLECIARGDWDRYQQLCDPTLSAFEPEGRGHLIEGLGFHQFYFELGGHMGPHNSTLATPHVRLLGSTAAVVSYVRLVQSADDSGQARTAAFEETRVWELQDHQWRHVHFHRSPAP